jgi:hypothetical protein
VPAECQRTASCHSYASSRCRLSVRDESQTPRHASKQHRSSSLLDWSLLCYLTTPWACRCRCHCPRWTPARPAARLASSCSLSCSICYIGYGSFPPTAYRYATFPARQTTRSSRATSSTSSKLMQVSRTKSGQVSEHVRMHCSPPHHVLPLLQTSTARHSCTAASWDRRDCM